MDNSDDVAVRHVLGRVNANANNCFAPQLKRRQIPPNACADARNLQQVLMARGFDMQVFRFDFLLAIDELSSWTLLRKYLPELHDRIFFLKELFGLTVDLCAQLR